MVAAFSSAAPPSFLAQGGQGAPAGPCRHSVGWIELAEAAQRGQGRGSWRNRLKVSRDRLTVALVSQVGEDERVDGIGDGTDRAIGEDGVEAAGVRSAKKILPAIVVSVVVGPRRLVGGPDDVVVPAGGVADVIVSLRLAQVSPVQALLGYHQGVGQSVG